MIIANNYGSRLWPLSRTLYPKQFLPLIDGAILLQATAARLENLEHQVPLYICNEEHNFIVSEQIRQKT